MLPTRPKLALIAAVLIVVGAGGLLRSTAGAAVVRATGFSATVAGWTSWYGSYSMGDLGLAWCIDHGSHAPDAALGYVPTDVADQTPELRTAMAWALGRHGPEAGPVTAAALMLVLHDIMGAVYPTGVIDVDTLPLIALTGLGGAEGEVLATAQAMKADALARQHLMPPLALRIRAAAVHPGERGALEIRLVDAARQPVPGVTVTVAATGAVLDGGAAEIGADGSAAVGFVAGDGRNEFSASALVPDLTLQAFASSTEPAQRVARPATVALADTARFVTGLPSTTTTTTTVRPTTTTTAPSTTTTQATTTTQPTTTTTQPPPTTSPPSTTTSTAALPPPSVPTLPRTGAPTTGLALVGSGLVLMGASLPRRRR